MHYFLTCDEVKVNINEGQYNFNDHYILWACSASKSPNALEGVDFLLTSPKLKKHAKLEPYILIVAAKADNLDVVRYLLTSEKIKTLDMYDNDCEVLYEAYRHKNHDIIDYLVNTLNMKIPDYFISDLDANFTHTTYNEVLAEIRAEKIANRLNNFLPDKTDTKKNKI